MARFSRRGFGSRFIVQTIHRVRCDQSARNMDGKDQAGNALHRASLPVGSVSDLPLLTSPPSTNSFRHGLPQFEVSPCAQFRLDIIWTRRPDVSEPRPKSGRWARSIGPCYPLSSPVGYNFRRVEVG